VHLQANEFEGIQAGVSRCDQTSSGRGTKAIRRRAVNKTINAFGDWVDACRNYRHEEVV
jgi:hypothetical protein